MHSAERTVLHLDVDAFFASVEQRDDPGLRDRPVAVGTGVVASCSYEARHWGVRTGMRLTEARILCPPMLIIPGDYRRYEQAARRIHAVCLEQTPQVEVAALDDLYLELTAAAQPESIADTLRTQVREEVGLSVAVGIGINKLVARVATKEAKPGKRRRVPPGAERTYLAPWPVRVLTGAGGRIGSRLERLNVQRVGEVALMPVPILRGLFGERGRVLRDQAHGIDHRPVEPVKPTQSVSRRASFDPPASDRAFLNGMLDYLLERATTWLRLHDLCARGLTLTIRYGDYETATGRESFRRPVSEAELKGGARERLGRLYQRRLPLRLLGIELAPLAAPDPQPTLFPDPDADKARRLAACKDTIRQRFGFLAVVSGSTLQLADRLEHDRDSFQLRTPCLTR